MAARVYDFRRQVTGRPIRAIPPIIGTGVARLWKYAGEGSVQKSLIVYNDGSVIAGEEFTLEQIMDSTVFKYIRGGTDERCEGSGWLHDTLVAAGYPCQYSVEDIYNGDDHYTDEYPVEDGI